MTLNYLVYNRLPPPPKLTAPSDVRSVYNRWRSAVILIDMQAAAALLTDLLAMRLASAMRSVTTRILLLIE